MRQLLRLQVLLWLFLLRTSFLHCALWKSMRKRRERMTSPPLSSSPKSLNIKPTSIKISLIGGLIVSNAGKDCRWRRDWMNHQSDAKVYVNCSQQAEVAELDISWMPRNLQSCNKFYQTFIVLTWTILFCNRRVKEALFSFLKKKNNRWQATFI